jgi:valyl-tRNA synthetase
VPLFGYTVPVLADEAVDPEYGTGLMMVCTFGDAEDVLKWRRDGLPLREVVTADGRLGELAGPYAGLQLTQARAKIVADLDAAGCLRGSESVRQVVGVHERCQTPVEFQIRPQWFIGAGERRPVPGAGRGDRVDPRVHAAAARRLDRRAQVGLEHHQATALRGAVSRVVLRRLRRAGAGPAG